MNHIILIDNYDSFTFNLADEFEKRGCKVDVWRNDVPAQQIMNQAIAQKGTVIVISPGPGRPQDAGSSMEVISINQGRVPLLGVCLGHQAMVQALGGEVDRAPQIVHGKIVPMKHDQEGLFLGLPSPMSVGRYHSLIAKTLPSDLIATAWCQDLVMAVKHRTFPMWGVQFHPESILTTYGGKIIENFLNMVKHA